MLENRITAFAFLLLFLTQAFSSYFMVADYYLDTSAYAATCVNKDKPWMHCNGHCQLCKKMQQHDKSDKQDPARRSGDDASQPLSSPAAIFVPLTPSAVATGRHYPEAASGKPIQMPRALFHPPGRSLA